MTDRELLAALRRYGYTARAKGGRFVLTNCWPASVSRLGLERLLESLGRTRYEQPH